MPGLSLSHYWWTCQQPISFIAQIRAFSVWCLIWASLALSGLTGTCAVCQLWPLGLIRTCAAPQLLLYVALATCNWLEQLSFTGFCCATNTTVVELPSHFLSTASSQHSPVLLDWCTFTSSISCSWTLPVASFELLVLFLAGCVWLSSAFLFCCWGTWCLSLLLLHCVLGPSVPHAIATIWLGQDFLLSFVLYWQIHQCSLSFNVCIQTFYIRGHVWVFPGCGWLFGTCTTQVHEKCGSLWAAILLSLTVSLQLSLVPLDQCMFTPSIAWSWDKDMAMLLLLMCSCHSMPVQSMQTVFSTTPHHASLIIYEQTCPLFSPSVSSYRRGSCTFWNWPFF